MRWLQISLGLLFLALCISIYSADFNKIFDVYNALKLYYPEEHKEDNPIIKALLDLVGMIYNAVAYAYATFLVGIRLGVIFIANAFSLGYIVTKYLGLPESVGHFAEICVIISYMLTGVEVFKSIRE